MGITIRKHRRNLSYEDATTLGEFWALAEHFDRSLYRERRDHWDERGYDEYIVAAEGHPPYAETPEQYVCRMETRREILAVLALCTEKQRERFLLHALYDLSYDEVAQVCGCTKVAVYVSIEAVRKKFLKNVQKPIYRIATQNGYKVRGIMLYHRGGQAVSYCLSLSPFSKEV